MKSFQVMANQIFAGQLRAGESQDLTWRSRELNYLQVSRARSASLLCASSHSGHDRDLVSLQILAVSDKIKQFVYTKSSASPYVVFINDVYNKGLEESLPEDLRGRWKGGAALKEALKKVGIVGVFPIGRLPRFACLY